jgi:hypothetical protein
LDAVESKEKLDFSYTKKNKNKVGKGSAKRPKSYRSGSKSSKSTFSASIFL